MVTNRSFGNMTTKHPQPRPGVFIIFSLFIFLFSVYNTSCDKKNKIKYTSPPGYDLNKPYLYKLPSSLDEISGVDFYPKDSSVFAIEDEHGWLYKIFLKTPLKIERWKFGKAGDYEDVAMADSVFYVLNSKGKLEKLKFIGDSVILKTFNFSEEGKNEYETLFYDKDHRRLIIICKDCENDQKKELTSLAFDPSTDSFSIAFVISTLKIKEQLKEEKFKFKPSAAAIHPLTGELYIISSVDKVLVILNKDHTVKSSYPINPDLFKQPEGLTFTKKGDLIISNESAKTGSANILFFKFENPNNQQ